MVSPFLLLLLTPAGGTFVRRDARWLPKKTVGYFDFLKLISNFEDNKDDHIFTL